MGLQGQKCKDLGLSALASNGSESQEKTDGLCVSAVSRTAGAESLIGILMMTMQSPGIAPFLLVFCRIAVAELQVSTGKHMNKIQPACPSMG